MAKLVSWIEIEEIRKRNLSNDDFSIQKAEVEASINGDNVKFIASLKYKNPEQWLISLKSNTGIEAVRALITSDTVLINDRLHKKLYYGSSILITKKYGIPVTGLPILLGDFIEKEKETENSDQCLEGIYEQTTKFENIEAQYVISCKEYKALQSKIISNNKDEMKISFSKIKEVEKRKFPNKIFVKDSKNNIEISINIRKISFNKIENLNFIPGKGFEHIIIK